jgi:hypothetical protein
MARMVGSATCLPAGGWIVDDHETERALVSLPGLCVEAPKLFLTRRVPLPLQPMLIVGGIVALFALARRTT